MLQLRFAPEARRERYDAKRYYDERGHAASAAFDEALRLALDTIERHPEAGALVGRNRRAWLIRGFPYSVIYRLGRNELYVLALAHHSRRPGYWQKRTPR